jgi:hypothetical protein
MRRRHAGVDDDPVQDRALKEGAVTGALTFVTVVFEADLPLLRLQARSMARYLDPAAVASLIVVDHCDPPMSTRQRSGLVQLYGGLADRVRYLTAADVLPDLVGVGWRDQQALKLAVHRLVGTEEYVALDAKNAFVRTTTLSDFHEDDGRLRLGRHSYVGHPLRSDVARTAAFLGVRDASVLDSFPVTHTPFVFVTDEVAALLEHLSVTGSSLARVLHENGLLEFPLYSSWLIREGRLDVHYGDAVVRTVAIWGSARRRSDVARALEEADRRQDVHLLAVHRRALARMSVGASVELADYLARVGLARSRRAGLLWILQAKLAWAASQVRRRTIHRVARRVLAPAGAGAAQGGDSPAT